MPKKGRLAPEDMKDAYQEFKENINKAISHKNPVKSAKARATKDTLDMRKQKYENTPAGKIIWG